MNPPQPSHPGFFPNLFSVLMFAIIMVGMFLGFTRVYPQLVKQWRQPAITASTNTIPEQIAPFVRGIISGVKTGAISSQRDNTPLNISLVKGYRQGVKTALLTSYDWYNLDRQLFHSRGIAIGVGIAIDTSKSTADRGTLAYEVKLIQQIQAALDTDIEALLSSNPDSRKRVITNYLEGLKKLSSEATNEIINMQRVIDEAQGIVDENTSLSQQFSDNFSSDTAQFQTENIDVNLDQFVKARQKAEEARVRVTSTTQILKQLSPLSSRLITVIGAVEANQEALAAGIKVAPVKGVNLPILTP